MPRLTLAAFALLATFGCTVGTNDHPLTSHHALSADAATVPTEAPPNVVMIVMDDMGQTDPFGGLTTPTPIGDLVVDMPAARGLAETGLVLPNFYTLGSTCAPTRASIISGMFPVRTGFIRHCGQGSERGIPSDYLSLVHLLNNASYRTGHFGKWHIGVTETKLPAGIGFEESTWSKGAPDGLFWCYTLNPHDGDPIPVVNGRYPEDALTEPPRHHLTEELTNRTIEFIVRAQADGVPFFVNLWHLAPHWPYDPPAAFLEKYPGCEMAAECVNGSTCCTADNPASYPGCTNEMLYAALLEHADHEIQRVLEVIDPNTYVFLFSDNGPSGNHRNLQQSPESGWGGKFSYLEGGIKNPLIVRGPNVPVGVSLAKAGTHDFVETLAELTDQAIPETDGKSFYPVLSGSEDAYVRHVEWIWRTANDWAYRRGDWKLVKEPQPKVKDVPVLGAPKCAPKPCLFNLEVDPSENENLRLLNPEKVKEMSANHLAFRKQVTELPLDFSLKQCATGTATYDHALDTFYLEGGKINWPKTDLSLFNDLEFTFVTEIYPEALGETQTLFKRGTSVNVHITPQGKIRAKLKALNGKSVVRSTQKLKRNVWQRVSLMLNYKGNVYTPTLCVNSDCVVGPPMTQELKPIESAPTLSSCTKPITRAYVRNTHLYITDLEQDEL